MLQIRPPEELNGEGLSVFLAGGITGCRDWHAELIARLADTSLVLLNPRREHFPEHPEAAREQIEWEHRHLLRADMILFWFPCETLCPITLFELGKCAALGKPLGVGTHLNYARRADVKIQLRLMQPDVNVVDSIADLAEEVRRATAVTC